jgi:hypothetical protein
LKLISMSMRGASLKHTLKLPLRYSAPATVKSSNNYHPLPQLASPSRRDRYTHAHHTPPSNLYQDIHYPYSGGWREGGCMHSPTF